MLAQPQQHDFRNPYGALDDDTDAATAQMIARLLQEDLDATADRHAAEQLALELALADSRPGSPIEPVALPAETNDRVEALRYALDAATALAAEKQDVEARMAATADSNWARQLSQQFEAQQRKEMLDGEFARQVQQLDDNGQDTDAPEAQEAESVLGRGRVAALMAPAAAEVSKDKGKGKAILNPHAVEFHTPAAPAVPAAPLPTCSICMEVMQPTSNPFEASRTAASSNMIPFGMFVGPREDKHTACLDCLAGYIMNKLDDKLKPAFPVRCPECPFEFNDDMAARILGPQTLPDWYHRKLLDSTPALYCPNRKCSERVILPEDDLGTTQAQCPSCGEVMCTACKSVWHRGYTCAEYEALPEGSRDPEDLATLQLASRKGWKQCPRCKIVVELTSGCNHLACPPPCGHHWCFVCNKDWDIAKVRCTNDPPCNLWDEDRLMGRAPAPRPPPPPPPVAAPPPPRVLNRVHDGLPVAPLPARPAARAPAFVPAPQFAIDDDSDSDDEEEDRLRNFLRLRALVEVNRIEGRRQALDHGALDWMEHGGPRPHRGRAPPHAFTQEFVQEHRCGYCGHQAYSLPALKEHFMEARHGVYSCCERFYRREDDMFKHIDGLPARRHDNVRLDDADE